LGWARANILFDRFKGMPENGSPMETLFLVLWRMRQQVDFQKSRVLVQALMNQQGAEPKHIEEAFEDLRESFFPFEQAKRDEEIKDLKKVMHRELARGPMSVKPMVDMTRETMKKKLSQGQAALQERADLLQSGRLQNLDQGDPFERARRRKRGASASWTEKGSAQPPVRPSQIHRTPRV